MKKLIAIILTLGILLTSISFTALCEDAQNAVDPIAYYTFDGANLGADEAGSYPLTDNGISTVVDGTSGKGVSFDSNHLYSTFLYNMNLLEGATDFTVSADAKFADGPDANQCIFSNGWQGQGGFSFGYSSSEWMFICADAVGGDWIAFNIKGALGDDSFNAYAWHNFTLTVKNGVDLAVYIDGKLAHSVTLGSTLNTVNADFPFAIGTTHSGGYPFNGAVDEVKAFNVGLTAEQVAALVADKETDKPDVDEPGTDEPAGDAPIADYTFDGADLGADEAGSYPLTNSNLATVVDGKVGDAAHFDNQHMFNVFLYNSADPLEGKSDFTVSAFAKLDAGVTADQHCIFSNGGWGNGGITICLNTHEWFFINVDTAAGAQDIGFNLAAATGNASFDAHEWHNYTVTVKDGTSICVYVDGALAYTTTLPAAISTTNANSPFAVGTTFNGGYPFCGAIDNVKVYACALTASEIEDIIDIDNIPDSGETPDDNVYAGSNHISSYNFEGYDFSIDAVGNYDLNLDSFSTVVKGKNGYGAHFDAEHLYNLFLYTHTDLLEGRTDFTVTAYAKLDEGVTADNHCIFSNGWQGAGGISFGFSSHQWMFITADVAGGDWIAFNLANATGDSSFSAYDWHNYALSLADGNKISVYIDGKNVFNQVFSTKINMTNADSKFVIGTTYNGGYPILGSVDEVNVFDTVLSPKQITSVMNSRKDTAIEGDLNFDVNVNANDLTILRRALLVDQEFDADYDINGDEAVDIRDLVKLKKIVIKHSENPKYKNPVLIGYADPDVLLYDGTYYLYATGDTHGYQVHTSKDLVEWTTLGELAVEPNLWGYSNGYWAPDVEYINGKFYMAVTCSGRLGLAVSDSPVGPFREAHDTVLFEDSIDGHLFVDDDGSLYLYYVSWRSGHIYGLYGVKLDDNMRPILETERLLLVPTKPWEMQQSGIVEGPFMLKRNGLYYLTYSGSHYESKNYAVGYAISESPLGSYERYEGNPILIGNDKVSGTGHHSITTSLDGSELWIVYHRHASTTNIHPRNTCIDRIRFIESDNGPDILEVTGPTTTSQLRQKIKEDNMIITTSIEQLRDPCILLEDGVYYAYGTGWVCYKNTSGLLSGNWEYVGNVVEIPADANGDYWAPEVHKYNGAYYMFTTYMSKTTGKRGCTVLKSDSPVGPFVEISDGHITPTDWYAIDGTLYVDEEGQPWMIFVREWVGTDDKVGRMVAAKMSDDLTRLISEPIELFRADDPKWATWDITDGCWLYKCENGELLMIWSNWDSEGYCVGVARSDNGKVDGNWTQDEELLYSKSMGLGYDGGHGMIFKSSTGQMYLSIHSPNDPTDSRKEKPIFIPIKEENGKLVWDVKE